MGKTIIAGVTQRQDLGRAAGIAAASAITAAAEAQSLEKPAVDYRAQPRGGQRCAGCAFFRTQSNLSRLGHCSMVIGDVAADAWCAIWAPAA